MQMAWRMSEHVICKRWRPFGTKRHCFHSTGLYTTQVMFRSAFPHLKDSNVSKVPQLFPVTRQCWLWCKVYRSYVTVQNHAHVMHCKCIKWGSTGYTAFLPLCGYILLLQMSTFTAFHYSSHTCHMVVTWLSHDQGDCCDWLPSSYSLHHSGVIFPDSAHSSFAAC